MLKPKWEKTDVAGVWMHEASQPGPTVGIIGRVHPDEQAGAEVLRAIRSNELALIDRGTLVLIAGNLAVEASVMRNIPGSRSSSGANLNRCFRELTPAELAMDPACLPYELRRAQALRPVLDRCAATLDFHEYSDPKGKPFIIGDSRAALEVGLEIGAPIISAGWAETEPGSTDEYMLQKGGIGLCYELGCKQYPAQNAKRGLRAAARFLQAMGLTDTERPPLFQRPNFVRTDRALVRTSKDFRMLGAFHNFQIITEPTPVARDGSRLYTAMPDDVMIFPPYNGHDPAIGTEITSIGKKVPSIEALLLGAA